MERHEFLERLVKQHSGKYSGEKVESDSLGILYQDGSEAQTKLSVTGV